MAEDMTGILLQSIVNNNNNDEISSSSSSTSSSSDEDFFEEVLAIGFENIREKRVCIRNYVEEIVPAYSEREFIMHFRISRALAGQLAASFADSEIYQALTQNDNSRIAISPEKHILIFLWFAGHETASYRDVADRFDICTHSLFNVITRISEFLSGMASRVIRWPNDDEKDTMRNHFIVTKGFPGIMGLIDGTHIQLDRPSERPDDYVNRKGFPSMILQGICNEDRKFIDVFIGYPGSVHDARVYRNSTIYPKLGELCADGYLLGDSAYPCTTTCITPYRDNGHLTAAQRHFNKRLSSCRIGIEHTFGILKQRFRQMYHLKLRGHGRIAHFIRACCVLHNLANANDMELFEGEDIVLDDQPEDEPGAGAEIPASGRDLRDELCRQLFTRRD